MEGNMNEPLAFPEQLKWSAGQREFDVEDA